MLIAIGANLLGPAGEMPLATCRAAAEALRGVAGLRFQAQSRWYATVPMPISDQPAFVNGAVRLHGAIDPAVLLAALHAIEARAGRVRGARDGARTLDLDIIAMGSLCREAPDPVLPHPRVHLRAFVLRPLLDVAPEWVHPRLGLTAAAMLAALPAGQAGGGVLGVAI